MEFSVKSDFALDTRKMCLVDTVRTLQMQKHHNMTDAAGSEMKQRSCLK